MSSLIQLLTTRVEIVTFTQSDLSSLFDLSGNDNSVGVNEGVSLSEITSGTTIHPHSGGPLVCPITMESVNEGESVMKINRCGHMFKETALRQWLDAHNRCPLCRGGI